MSAAPCACGAPVEGRRKLCADCRRVAAKVRLQRWLDGRPAGTCDRCREPATDGQMCAKHRAATRARAKRTGNAPGRRPDPRCDRYVELFRAGKTVVEVAVAVGRSRSSVAGVLRQRGALPARGAR